MKVKTHIIEVPTERFIVTIKGLEIVVSDIDDLDILLEKYGLEVSSIGTLPEPDIPDEKKEVVDEHHIKHERQLAEFDPLDADEEPESLKPDGSVSIDEITDDKFALGEEERPDVAKGAKE